MSWASSRLRALRSALRITPALIAAGAILAGPFPLYAEGVSLLADLEYFFSQETSSNKITGNITDTEFSRFSQLYRLDVMRQLYPNLLFRLGGTYENDDSSSQVRLFDFSEVSSDRTVRTIRPRVSLDLKDPIYKANLAYNTRDVETSSDSGLTESLMVEEYSGVLNWRPVDLPLLNVSYLHTEIQDEPLTVNSTRDALNAYSKYFYRDFRFQYSYNSSENFDNIHNTGDLVQNHNGRVDYRRGFDFGNNRIDMNAAARLMQSSLEFSGGGGAVDTPAAERGAAFYILNDSPPTSNERFDLILVESGNPLTNVNIGRGGGISPVSAGLSFDDPTDVETVYIQLSDDAERFPELASSSQVSGIASSFRWQFFSSDDQFELNWTEHSISSATYNSIDNRFEIRVAGTVSARRIKVTTTPLTLVAPGEIRYQSIRAFTSLGRQNPENRDQNYTFGVGWSRGERTRVGYETSYRKQEAEPGGTERGSWTNSINFRYLLSQVFSTYGSYYRNERTRTAVQNAADSTDQSYSIALRGNYMETLNQSLIFTGWDSTKSDESSNSRSVLLRTNADLYDGWSMNLDLNYSLNTLATGADQTVKSLYMATNLQPNRRVDINFDYSTSWIEDSAREDTWTQYGTFQILWSITDTLNTFFRYNFRDQEGATDSSSVLREFSVNWSPFSEGDLRFALAYSESIDEGNQEIKSISPGLTWKIARGIFMELRYDTGTFETQTEVSDYDSYIAKFRFFY